ncbi:hypothetical protein QTG56_25455 (plasmid) [Rossellomorea sp. AcN35-11]|nr:hypothetical protein [Rossellomorea aquimaris]WJV31963.1 hypothetical protein QTG56_25455 [Rossellomorea sp. AcN35-11]
MNKWEFKSMEDLKKFAGVLSEELLLQDEADISRDVSYFTRNTFTTSSEYLGEFRILLEEVIKDIKLNSSLVKTVKKAIKSIDKGFR